VVGAGFTGLWTALLAKERDPSADVVLLEGRTAGWAASGRNGGFCAASLTHGLANGLERFGPEMPVLDRLGRQNLDEIEATVARHGIDCDFERTGTVRPGLAPARPVGARRRGAAWRPPRVRPGARTPGRGQGAGRIASPGYYGGLWDQDGCALWTRPGWLGAAPGLPGRGCRIYEQTPVGAIARRAGHVFTAARRRAHAARAAWAPAPTGRCCSRAAAPGPGV
jgi:glycine/D-amino acid oxidase-like deaminating enzyme